MSTANSILAKQGKSTVAAPPPQSFTQGLIFSCGVATEYEGCESYGLAITARCDAANEKVQIYNYLPVVTLDDWLHRDGRAILAGRLQADALGGLANILKDSGFAPSVLQTEPADLVVEQLLPATATDKGIVSARKKAKEQLQRYNLALQAAQSLPKDRICFKVKSSCPKLVTVLVDELVRHKLSGYYFLEQVDINGDDRGFVVLAREIQAIPRKLAQLILVGLSHQSFSAICVSDPEFKGRLQFGPMEIAMPLGILKSPNVEHLMQNFALLFSRIGITDLSPEYVSSLWERQPSVLEEQP